MSRLVTPLALLLALLLPLQFAWGAAAGYCGHEQAAPQRAGHFGHHEHVHHEGTGKPADAKGLVDADCAFCNAAAPHALAHGLPAVAEPLSRPRATGTLAVSMVSAYARAPDRPQWRRLA